MPAQFPIIFGIAAIVATLVALYAWMTSPTKVLDEIDALNLDATTKAALKSCCESAKAADNKVRFYDLSAPLVMALVLPFVKREADRLPRMFSAWDNNVSLNGDGEVVRRGDAWVNLRDIGWTPEPGEQVIRYDDPLYDGDAYYAKGFHPRSFWARYVWVGLRNRASMLSVKLGRDVTARPVVVSGDPAIHRHGPYGHFVLRHGDTFHYKSIRAFGPFAPSAPSR